MPIAAEARLFSDGVPTRAPAASPFTSPTLRDGDGAWRVHEGPGRQRRRTRGGQTGARDCLRVHVGLT
jgi:hypothetical protein